MNFVLLKTQSHTVGFYLLEVYTQKRIIPISPPISP